MNQEYQFNRTRSICFCHHTVVFFFLWCHPSLTCCRFVLVFKITLNEKGTFKGYLNRGHTSSPLRSFEFPFWALYKATHFQLSLYVTSDQRNGEYKCQCGRFGAGVTRSASDLTGCWKWQWVVLAEWQKRRTTHWDSDLIVDCVSPGRSVCSVKESKQSSHRGGGEEDDDDDGECLGLIDVLAITRLFPFVEESFLPLLCPCKHEGDDGYSSQTGRSAEMDRCVRRMHGSVGRHGLSCGPRSTWRCQLWAVFK